MYYELSISLNPIYEDSIYTLLYVNGAKYILEEDGFIKVYFKSYEKKKIMSIENKLKKELNIPPVNIFITELQLHNWNKEWKNSIVPIFIKDKIIIFPSWKRKNLKNVENKILIEIDPKMSFGTGYNDTTQLILELMCDYIIGNEKYLLDYGCGTGILAIAGIKLGIKKAVAIDNDIDSIREAKENCRINKTNRKIILYLKDINKIVEKDFDIIVCNIDSKIISKNIHLMSRKLVNGGKLLITGILSEEKNKIITKLRQHNFEVVEERSKTEWVAYYAVKF